VARILSIGLASSKVLVSSREFIQTDFRFLRIIKAAFITILVNQVVRADRPSKLGKWRYPERNAS
jgi:hypothetical protein